MNESHLSCQDRHLRENDAAHVVKSNNVQTEIKKRLPRRVSIPRDTGEESQNWREAGGTRGENLTLTLNAL